MTSYFKLALKVLGRRKFFTFISLFGISMTLVVLMVATAVVDNVFGARAPESRFDRVLVVYRLTIKGPNNTMSTSPGFKFVHDYVKTLSGVERASAFTSAQNSALYRGTSRIDVALKRTDGEYWKILDFRFLEGRPYTVAEDDAGTPVAVITDRLRAKVFDGPAVGKTIQIGTSRYRVIGVVPHVSMTRMAAYADVWAPIGTLSSSSYRHDLMGGFDGIVLAKSRDDFARLKNEFNTKLRSFPLDRPAYTEVITGLDTPFEAAARVLTLNRAGDRAPLIMATVLIALAVGFMVLPALNLVTLNLSRILERSSEIGVRKAFGAPRRALVAQFVLENVILTVIGGVIGFALAVVVIAAISASNVIPNTEFDINFRIFAVGMFIAVFFGVLSGLYPALRMSRLNPVNALRGGAV